MVNLLRKILSLFVFLLLCGFVSAQEKTKELSLDSYLDKILNEVLKRRQLNQTGQNLNTNLNQNQFQAQLDKKNKEEEKKKKSAEMQKMFGTLSQLLGSVGFGGAVNNLPNNLNSNVMPDIFPGSNQSTFPGSTQPVQNSQAAAYYPANTLQRYLGDSGANISQQIGLSADKFSPASAGRADVSIGSIPKGDGSCVAYGDSIAVGLTDSRFGGSSLPGCKHNNKGGKMWSYFWKNVVEDMKDKNIKIVIWEMGSNGNSLQDTKPAERYKLLAGFAKDTNKILLLPVYNSLGQGIKTQMYSDEAAKEAKKDFPDNIVLIDYSSHVECQKLRPEEKLVKNPDQYGRLHYYHDNCYNKLSKIRYDVFNKVKQKLKNESESKDAPSS